MAHLKKIGRMIRPKTFISHTENIFITSFYANYSLHSSTYRISLGLQKSTEVYCLQWSRKYAYYWSAFSLLWKFVYFNSRWDRVWRIITRARPSPTHVSVFSFAQIRACFRKRRGRSSATPRGSSSTRARKASPLATTSERWWGIAPLLFYNLYYYYLALEQGGYNAEWRLWLRLRLSEQHDWIAWAVISTCWEFFTIRK